MKSRIGLLALFLIVAIVVLILVVQACKPLPDSEEIDITKSVYVYEDINQDVTCWVVVYLDKPMGISCLRNKQ
jgi:hypothetical protein